MRGLDRPHEYVAPIEPSVAARRVRRGMRRVSFASELRSCPSSEPVLGKWAGFLGLPARNVLPPAAETGVRPPDDRLLPLRSPKRCIAAGGKGGKGGGVRSCRRAEPVLGEYPANFVDDGRWWL